MLYRNGTPHLFYLRIKVLSLHSKKKIDQRCFLTTRIIAEGHLKSSCYKQQNFPRSVNLLNCNFHFQTCRMISKSSFSASFGFQILENTDYYSRNCKLQKFLELPQLYLSKTTFSKFRGTMQSKITIYDFKMCSLPLDSVRLTRLFFNFSSNSRATYCSVLNAISSGFWQNVSFENELERFNTADVVFSLFKLSVFVWFRSFCNVM